VQRARTEPRAASAAGEPCSRCPKEDSRTDESSSEFGTGGEERLAHQVGVNRARGFAAFPNRPHHQRLSATRVARGENSRQARHVVLALHVAAWVELQAELRDYSVGLGAEKSQREQHEVAFDLEIGFW